MPRDPVTGVYTRVSNTFSEPVIGDVIDPVDAETFWDDLTDALNDIPPAAIAGRVTSAAELQAAATAGGSWSFGGSIATTAKISVTGDNFSLIGDDQFTAAITCSDVDAPVFEIANDIDVVFKNMTITHTGTPIAGGDGIKFLGITQISLIENIYGINNYMDLNLGPASDSVVRGCLFTNHVLRGISISATAASSSLQWHIYNTLSENVSTAGGANYYVTSVGGSPGNATMGTWIGANSFGGSGYGIHLVGDATHGIFAGRFIGCFLGGEATACFKFENVYGSRHQIADCYLEQCAAGSGILADANCLSLYVSDTIIAQMGVSGIVSAAPVLSVTGGEIGSNTSIGIDITAAARVGINDVYILSNGTGIRLGAFAINATIGDNTLASNSTPFTNNQVGGTVRALGNTGITDTAINGVTITSTGTSTLSMLTGKTLAINNSMTLAADADGQQFVFPAASDFIVGAASTNTLTHKTYDTAGAGNSFSINGLAATANTGTGSVVRATSPTLVTPALGTPSALVLTNATTVAWTTWTPTITFGAGSGTIARSGRYLILGKTVFLEYRISVTAIGTILNTTGTVDLPTPIVAATAAGDFVLSGYDRGVTALGVAGSLNSGGSTIAITATNGTGANIWGAVGGFTTNSVVVFSGTIEIA